MTHPAIACATTNYFNFKDRAPRSEYWLFALLVTVLTIVFSLIDIGAGTYNTEIGYGTISGIFTLLVFIPSLAAAARRLHDTNRSGFWLLISFVPLIGIIWLLVLLVLKGSEGDNRFGPDPLGTAPAEIFE